MHKNFKEKCLKDGTNKVLIEKSIPNNGSKSEYRNITYDKTRNKYVVQMDYKGIHYNFGRFKRLKDAIIIRDLARKKRIDGSFEEWIKESIKVR